MSSKAQIALATAHSFFKDVDDTLSGQNTASPSELFNTLSLGSRKVLEAEQLDPSVTLPSEDGTFSVPLADIKSMGIGLQAKIHLLSGEFKKSIPLYDRALQISPHFAICWAGKAAAHAELRQKPEALSAIQKAIEHDPDNINYHKSLEEIKSLSGTEIAAHKVMNAGRKTWTGMKLVFFFFMVLPFIMIIMGLSSGNKESIGVGVGLLVVYGMFMMAYDKVRSFFS